MRPAFYALAPGRGRDLVTLLHVPYTLWHLSYVAVGAALAPRLAPDRLGWTLAAFALALGVGGHALDELRGRPLRTEISDRTLWALAAGSIGGAAAIGVLAATWWTPWLLAFVAAGVFLVAAYNLELLGGRFHTDAWFALAWGAFPLLTGFFAAAERLSAAAVVAAGGAALLSLAQRRLSTPARALRRRVRAVEGVVTHEDGSAEPLTRETLLAAPEGALRALAAAVPLLAAALLLMHWG